MPGLLAFDISTISGRAGKHLARLRLLLNGTHGMPRTASRISKITRLACLSKTLRIGTTGFQMATTRSQPKHKTVANVDASQKPWEARRLPIQPIYLERHNRAMSVRSGTR